MCVGLCECGWQQDLVQPHSQLSELGRTLSCIVSSSRNELSYFVKSDVAPENRHVDMWHQTSTASFLCLDMRVNYEPVFRCVQLANEKWCRVVDLTSLSFHGETWPYGFLFVCFVFKIRLSRIISFLNIIQFLLFLLSISQQSARKGEKNQYFLKISLYLLCAAVN